MAVIPLDPDHRAEHALPTGPEDRGHLPPTQPPAPARQEDGVDVRQVALAVRPGQEFGRHPAAWAVHPAAGVDQEHAEGPQRDKREPPRWQRVVTWPAPAAARTDRARAAVRPHGDLDLVAVEAGFFIHEALDFVHAVEDGLEAHRSASPIAVLVSSQAPTYRNSGRCVVYPNPPLAGAPRPGPAASTPRRRLSARPHLGSYS